MGLLILIHTFSIALFPGRVGNWDSRIGVFVHPFSQSMMLRYSDETEALDFAATILHFSSDVCPATLARKYKRSTVSFFMFPSLISLMVSVDVKHHVYLVTSSCVSLICQPDI